MHRLALAHVAALGAMVSTWPTCSSRTSGIDVPDEGGAADATAASVAPSSSVVAAPSADAPISTTCEKDSDCQPLNCCFALKPESCVTRARARCDGFQLTCDPYTGPQYACACVKAQCTGNPAGSRDDAGAKDESWATGALAPKVVLDAIIKHGPDIRACHAVAKKANGQVSMTWNVLPTGKVDRPLVVLSSVGSTPLSTCLVKKVGGWKFPRAKGPTRVTYDFRFGR